MISPNDFDLGALGRVAVELRRDYVAPEHQPSERMISPNYFDLGALGRVAVVAP